MKIILLTAWQKYMISCHPKDIPVISDALLTMRSIETDVLHHKYYVPGESQETIEIELVLDKRIDFINKEPSDAS